LACKIFCEKYYFCENFIGKVNNFAKIQTRNVWGKRKRKFVSHLPGEALVGGLKDPLAEEGPEPGALRDGGAGPHAAVAQLELGGRADELGGHAPLLQPSPPHGLRLPPAALRLGSTVIPCNTKKIFFE